MARPEALMKKLEVVLEDDLRLSLEFGWQAKSRGHHHLRIEEAAAKAPNPVGMNDYIVVRKRHYVARSSRHRRISGGAQTRASFPDIADAGEALHDQARTVRSGRIINDHDLM